MEREAIIFMAFLALASASHACSHKLHPKLQAVADRLPYLAPLTHPTLLDAIRDYAIHLVVYSGHILGH